MDESTILPWVLEELELEGEIRAYQRCIFIFVESRLGAPPEAVRIAIKSITDIPRLQRLVQRTIHAADWTDLLATQ